MSELGGNMTEDIVCPKCEGLGWWACNCPDCKAFHLCKKCEGDGVVDLDEDGNIRR